MENKTNPAILLTLTNLILISSLFANTMEIEIDNGISVILHRDHSWTYKTNDSPELTEDTSIMLKDGQVIQIKRNHTWFYVQGNQSKTEQRSETSYLSTAYSAGKAQGNNLIKTKRTAMNQAYKQLAKQLKASFKKENLTIENLIHCMENEGKEVKINDRVKKGIWKVEVSMSLNEEQIERVINCAIP